MTLGRAVLIEHLTGPPLRHRQYAAELLDRFSAAGGA